MNPAVIQVAVMLIGMQVSRKLDWENPNTVFYVRAAYVASNIIIALIYLYTHLKIKSKNDLTMLKYVDQPQPFSGDTERPLVTTTIRDYDTQQLLSAIKATGTGVLMMAVMHLYFKFSQPLLIQSVMPLKTVFDSKVIQVHVLGKIATGDLKRPWKATGMFAGASGSPETDKAAIKKAERETRGPKEE